VNETGKDSPELKPVAEALAGSGFRVVVPDFARLRRQNVTAADIDELVFVIRSLEADTGILCASYGCGPALIAAGRTEVRDRVRFVATYGAYFDLQDTLRFIVTAQPSPFAYSKWAYMGANSDLIESGAGRQLLLAIAAERLKQPAGPWVLGDGDLDTGARAMLSLFESRTTEEFDQRLRAVPQLRERLAALSPSRHLKDLRARLIVVHLSSDPSIPSSESLRMAAAAAANRIPHRLTILHLYGHTRPDWPNVGFRNLFGLYVPEGWKFIRVLGEVLSYA
jgi:hypothetical protein